MNWDKLENGELLKAAANAGFDVIITVDKKIEHEQNLGTLPIPIVLIDSHSNALASLRLFDKPVLELLSNPIDRALWIVQNDGKVLRLTEPRQ